MSNPTSNGMSLVNMSARQRMLSQRLTLQILLAAQGAPDRAQAAEQSLFLFEQSQAQLVKTAKDLPGPDGQVLQQVYFGPQGVAQSVEHFIQNAQAAMAHAKAPKAATEPSLLRLVSGVDDVLEALNAATSAFDQISAAKEVSIMRELKGIVGDIQSVAREAKVVSFNAQVIAARAGAVGREFAVVASTLSSISSEVDTLAKKGLALTTR